MAQRRLRQWSGHRAGWGRVACVDGYHCGLSRTRFAPRTDASHAGYIEARARGGIMGVAKIAGPLRVVRADRADVCSRAAFCGRPAGGRIRRVERCGDQSGAGVLRQPGRDPRSDTTHPGGWHLLVRRHSLARPNSDANQRLFLGDYGGGCAAQSRRNDSNCPRMPCGLAAIRLGRGANLYLKFPAVSCSVQAELFMKNQRPCATLEAGMSANVWVALKYVRESRSCQVSWSSSHIDQRKPRKKVPAESIYPMLRRSICLGVGGSPEKLVTCKFRSIMPGVVPPKIVKRVKYCRYTMANVIV